MVTDIGGVKSLKRLVELSGDDINQLFDVLEDWETILKAEKSILNNKIENMLSAPSSKQGGA